MICLFAKWVTAKNLYSEMLGDRVSVRYLSSGIR